MQTFMKPVLPIQNSANNTSLASAAAVTGLNTRVEEGQNPRELGAGVPHPTSPPPCACPVV